MKGIVIGGVSSGSGKTTFSMGLMYLLKQKGIKVAAFKAGPDYIDPMYHRQVLSDDSYNLPVWMVSDENIKHLFVKRSAHAEFSIIEGVMGYFDGHSPQSIEGSTANLASLLKVPALIVMDAGKMSLTAASIIKGLETFVPQNQIKGVVFNRVQTDSHYQLLKEAVETHTGVKCYGRMPYDPSLALESRHLGLLQASEINDLFEKLDKVVGNIEKHVDWEGIIRAFNFEPSPSLEASRIQSKIDALKAFVDQMGGLTLGIAKDLAFSFYYDENLRTLEEIGVTLVPFSPLDSPLLPKNIDALYLGGGYPEEFAKRLSANVSFVKDFLEKTKKGLPVYAECGGLMYLAKTITDREGNAFDMVGVFDADSQMTERLQRFGHVTSHLTLEGKTIAYRAHEFHKSTFTPRSEIQTAIVSEKRDKSWSCGYRESNVLATYAHNHFYSNLDFLEHLLSFWSKKKRNICT